MERKMKDSGVDWIGIIPNDWCVEKGKHFFAQRNTKGNESPVLLAATQKSGMIPQSLLEGVVQVKLDTDLQTFKTVHIGDFVISLRSFQGGFEMSDYEGVCSPAYQVFYNTQSIFHKYYKYLFKSYGFISKMNSLVVGIREGKNIQYEDFAESMLPIPPLHTQQRIADFLDRKCAEIDELAALQETMIAELKRYKQSIITEAVTKGLDPDVPMKDSGVEWIGEIPEGWEVKRLKLVANRRNEKADDTKLKYIGLEHIVGFSKEMVETENVYDNEGANMCYARDVIFGKLRPYLGKAKVIEDACCCSSEFLVLCNVHRPDYLRYLMLSGWFIEIVNASTYGTKMPRANADFIMNMLIPVPHTNEQQQIADYLDRKCAEIDELIAIKQQKIEALKEYKKSVIFEYVTGKKEVAK